MNTGLKITAFAAALAATFGTAYGVGSAVDPVVAETEPAEHAGHATKEKDGVGAHEGHDQSGGGETSLPGGLQIADQGFALDLKTPRVEAGKASELRFAIVDQDAGRNVTDFRREHGKELHLIVASRDLTTYRHLHPVRAEDGTWSTRVELPKAGGYRVFADFAPAAKDSGLTLGADLAVAGASNPQPLPRSERKATVDGYEVTLKGDLRPGTGSELKLSVAKDGRAVTDLQPYLGAYGHLVALRSGDLAYLHVHPNGEPGDGRTKPGPEISFTATAPSKGSYRLFLDFQHEGKVRTAAFTVQTGVAAAQQPEPEGHESSGHQH
ncbi:hypothetical protein [Streptomyces xantholiticus]|uniref:hypothetical protein n=1 Tax=Streptomyces xantholiticus TaxID=68285 RepID=UPI00167B2AED|nr:hypothetical protein [Streptomyces xantholiticus]GGW71871.1 hypothetical protein GCM10010381_65730 [Streptomyces xantholiticus]